MPPAQVGCPPAPPWPWSATVPSGCARSSRPGGWEQPRAWPCPGTRTGSSWSPRSGATAIVPERGDEGVARLKEMFGGIGPDIVLECVGTKQSMDQALRSARPGGQIGFVGLPLGGPELPVRQLYMSTVGARGGLAPVRAYVDELLPEVMAGTIEPGRVFDTERPLDQGE